MAGFDAGTAVQELKWTFKPDVDAAGVIPEPPDKVIDEFWHGLRDLLGAEDNDEAVKAVSDADEALARQIAEIYAALCQQCPSVEQILRLPYRKRQVFYGWLTGQITNPE